MIANAMAIAARELAVLQPASRTEKPLALRHPRGAARRVMRGCATGSQREVLARLAVSNPKAMPRS